MADPKKKQTGGDEKETKGGGGHPHGYLEETPFGATWHSTNGGKNLSGDAALQKGAQWGVGPGFPEGQRHGNYSW